MNKQTITFTASEQTLTKTGGIEHYASNIVSYIEASFTLGDNWAGYDSIRAVWESGYARIATVLDANNKCIVPAEVLTYKSKVNVNLVGSIVENTVLTDRLTTYPILALTVDADARVDSSETTPVTASQFEQFVDVVRDEASAIQNYTYDSEAWAVGQRAGVDVPSTDETYQNNAKYYADQGATLQQEVSDLKSELTKSLDGNQTFGQIAPFAHYGLNTDGTYKTTQTYRVSCDTHIILDRGISISVANGFKWGYIPFVNGSAGDWSGFITTDSALPKGMEFVVQIARVTEDPSEVADVGEFVSAITFSSNIGNKVDSLNNEIENEYALITGADVTLGNWANGEVTYNWLRLCTKQLIPIKAGDKVRYKTNTLQIGFGLFVNGEAVEYSGWLSSPTETEYIFQQDGLFFAQFRKSDNAGVELYEYDTVCKLYTGVRYDINHLANDVASLRDEVGRYNYACLITDGTPPNPGNAQCVYTSNKIPVKFGDHISLKTNRPVSASAVKYIYGVCGYNSSDTLIVNQSPTARASLPSDYVVNREDVAYIRYSVTEMDGSGNVVSVRASSFVGYDVVVYVDSDSKFYEYKYSGDYIGIKKKTYNVLATNLKVPTTTAVGASALQGFAMYNSKAIQLYSNPSKLAIVDMSDNSVIATVDGQVGHGNTIDFFNEFEDASDMFPLALVADGISNEAYKVRIQTSGVTVKETIKFPIEQCGYYVSTMLDKLNKIIYTAGYYEESYNTDSGSNKMVIGKWDYSNLTANGDGSVTPAFVESFYVPYFTTLQGPTFYNGKLFIISSKASVTDADTKVYVIDPIAKRITSLIEDFPYDIKAKETEGLYFYDNGEDIGGYLKNGDSTMAFFMMTFKE